MARLCGKCSRTNPDEAIYCYHDGHVLGVQRSEGPLHTCLRPFPRPLVFPPGQPCINYEQLMYCCQADWAAGVRLLQEGALASFLAELGRTDLALAARKAAQGTDPAQGLNELLKQLPSRISTTPRLIVHPAEITLGTLPSGKSRCLSLQLSNEGMCLIYGTISSDCVWLALGDAPGSPQRMFRFSRDEVVQVHVHGQHLHASPKPLEGYLRIESNGGSLTVVVRVEVPVQPFSRGVLAGARSPRQLIEKLCASPRESVELFDSGAVREWYRQNNWPYPVQGPSAVGLDGIHQFFQALGLGTDGVLPEPSPVLPSSAPVPLVSVAPIPALMSKPFPEGILAGVVSPQQLIEAVQAAPGEAAPLFNSGAVAEWYRANGWVYPVQGPRAAGVDAVFQFLKANGLSLPPVDYSLPAPSIPQPAARSAQPAQTFPPELPDLPVVMPLSLPGGEPAPAPPAQILNAEIVGLPDAKPPGKKPVKLELRLGSRPVSAVRLTGVVGSQLQKVITARARGSLAGPLRARITSDQPWLGVKTTRCGNNMATVVLKVDAVPDCPGETLRARLQVTLNETLSQVVPVTLAVGKGPGK